MRGAFMTAATGPEPGCWSFGACFGVGFEYSLKDLFDRLDCRRPASRPKRGAVVTASPVPQRPS